VKAVICGMGPYGFIVGIQAALHALGRLPSSLPPSVAIDPK